MAHRQNWVEELLAGRVQGVIPTLTKKRFGAHARVDWMVFLTPRPGVIECCSLQLVHSMYGWPSYLPESQQDGRNVLSVS